MARSMVTLLPGEEAKVILEANMYAAQEGLIWNIILFIVRIIETLLGMRRRGILTVTNKRVILEGYQTFLCCFEKSRFVVTIMPQAVASVDFDCNSLCCCLCKRWRFIITANDGRAWGFIIRNGYSEAAAIANYTIETLFENK